METLLTTKVKIDPAQLGYLGSLRKIDGDKFDRDAIRVKVDGKKTEKRLGRRCADICTNNLLKRLGVSDGLKVTYEGVCFRDYMCTDEKMIFSVTCTESVFERVKTLLDCDGVRDEYMGYLESRWYNGGISLYQGKDFSDCYTPITKRNGDEFLRFLIVEAIYTHRDKLDEKFND